MSRLPVTFAWRWINAVDEDGEVRRIRAMVPLQRFERLAARQFVENDEYPMVVQEHRSLKSHRFFFASVKDSFDKLSDLKAAVKEAHDNLPEELAPRWDTAEQLRKWCLIETGFYDEKEFLFEGRGADRQAMMLGNFIRTGEEYARIFTQVDSKTSVRVIVRRAKSQAENAMRPDEFKASSKAILELLEHLIGVARGSLKKNAGKHA